MKSSYLTKGGIYTALSIILIYLSIVLPINKFYLLGAASCIIPLSILTTDIKNSCIVYAAVSLLSILLFGPKGIVVSYIALFGLYGFVKYFVERIRKTPIELILKFVFFNSSTLLLFFFYKALFLDAIKVDFPVYLLFAALQVIFLIYDYALTVFISYINTKVIKKLG